MSNFEVIYRGARVGNKGQLIYRYDRVGAVAAEGMELEMTEGTVLLFLKPFKRPCHRVGDVLRLTEKDKGKYTMDSKAPERHEDAPDDSAADQAARQSVQADRISKKLAAKDDLGDAIEPLRRAYRRMTAPERAAMITWVVRRMMSW